MNIMALVSVIRKRLFIVLHLTLFSCVADISDQDQSEKVVRDFFIVDEKPLHYSNVRRFNIYITTDAEKSDKARIEKVLESLVETYLEIGREFNALSIFVFRTEDEEDIGSIDYTLARGVYAPNGN